MEQLTTSGGATVHVIDLQFQGRPGRIASFAIPHAGGVALIEAGPGSTVSALERGLKQLNYGFNDVTDVFLTHIHLDHGGAAGWLARRGARILVHERGAPHLSDPAKLVASAARIYGDDMDRLWGECLPVPSDKLRVVGDRETLDLGDWRIQALDTPGHALHHLVFVVDDVAFTGDAAGVRVPGTSVVTPPMPPPELDLDAWRHTINRMRELELTRFALTHFGVFDDPQPHLQSLEQGLDDVDDWLRAVMPRSPEPEELRERFTVWSHERALANGLDEADWQVHEDIDPAWMSADGLMRYWRKHRAGD